MNPCVEDNVIEEPTHFVFNPDEPPAEIQKMMTLEEEIDLIMRRGKKQTIDQFADYCSKYSAKNLQKWSNLQATNRMMLAYEFKTTDVKLMPKLHGFIKEFAPDLPMNLNSFSDRIKESMKEVQSEDEFSESFGVDFKGLKSQSGSQGGSSNIPSSGNFSLGRIPKTLNIFKQNVVDCKRFFRCVYVNGMAKMVLVSWFKITFSTFSDSQEGDFTSRTAKLSQTRSKTTSFQLNGDLARNKIKRNYSNASLGTKANAFHTTTYWAKTLKVFDILENEHTEILVEAVPIEEYEDLIFRKTKRQIHSYDCSTVQWRNFLYFFQRQVNLKTGLHNLQLVRLDLANPELGVTLVQNYIIKTSIDPSQAQQIETFLNTVFSKKICCVQPITYQTEASFLDDQFVLVQEYLLQPNSVHNKASFNIYSLSNIKQSLLVRLKEKELPKKQSIHSIYHFQVSKSDLQKTIKFLVKDCISQTELDVNISIFNEKVKIENHSQDLAEGARVEQLSDEFIRRKSVATNVQLFMKPQMSVEDNKFKDRSRLQKLHEHESLNGQVHQQPQVESQVQSITLQLSDSDKPTQYYYVIAQNFLVVPIYPIPQEKILQMRIIDLIKQKLKIDKIRNEDDDYSSVHLYSHRDQRILITGHPTLRLLQMLNLLNDKDLEGMTIDQLDFVFAEDRNRQMIAILDSSNPKKFLMCLFLQNHSFLDCHPKNQLVQAKNQDGRIFRKLKRELNSILFRTDLWDENQGSTLQRPRQTVSHCMKESLMASGAVQPQKRKTLEDKRIDPSIFDRNQFMPSIKDIYSCHRHKEPKFFKHYQEICDGSGDEKICYILIKNFDSKWTRVRLFDLQQFREKCMNFQNRKVEVALKWMNQFDDNDQLGYFFIFSFKFEQGDKLCQSYFILTKSYEEMQKVFYDRNDLIAIEEKQHFIINQDKTIELYFQEARQQMKDVTMQTYQQIIDNINTPDDKLSQMKLIFSRCPDQRYPTNFVTLILMKKDVRLSRYFVAYDIVTRKFISMRIIMKTKNLDLIHQDHRDFDSFTYCQSSDYVQPKDQPTVTQVKFTLFTMFKQELGLIKCRELLVTKTQQDLKIQIIGMKHVFLSNELLKQCNYQLLASQSFAIPLYQRIQVKQDLSVRSNFTRRLSIRMSRTDLTPRIKRQQIQGCTLILFNSSQESENLIFKNELDPLQPNKMRKSGSAQSESKNKEAVVKQRAFFINFGERTNNNQFRYSSDVILFGHSKIKLSPILDNVFAHVYSVQLRTKWLEQQTFNNNEALYLLENFSQRQIGLKVADLKQYIATNFNSLIDQNFFLNQELFEGKSLLDLCLNDLKLVTQALNKQLNTQNLEDTSDKVETSVQLLVDGDMYRKRLLQSLSLTDQQNIIDYDFNLNGTVKRALELNANQSIKVVLEFVLGHRNNLLYNNLIMLDILPLLQQRNLDFYLYFSRSQLEFNLNMHNQKLCCFEQLLSNIDLPQFSNTQSKAELILKANIFDEERDAELAQSIREREANTKESAEKQRYKVEHFYTNFSFHILSQKLRSSNFKMDQLELARLIKIKSSMDDIDFFKQDTIQRLIDFQWGTSYSLNMLRFGIFIFCYLIPLIWICLDPEDSGQVNHDSLDQVVQHISTAFIDEQEPHLVQLKLCLCAMIFNMIVEVARIKLNGVMYFCSPRNWLFFLEFVIFLTFFKNTHYGAKHLFNSLGFGDMKYLNNEFRLLLVVIAFFTLMEFIRMSDKMGFLVRMISTCVYELIPFLMCFIMFLLFFSLCLIVLNNSIDSEVSEGAQDIGYIHQTIFQAFRTSIGELGVPNTSEIFKRQSGFSLTLNVALIWIVWYTQTFTMLVVMLNFIIAVINATYDKVKNDQVYITYAFKADLNFECFEILSMIKRQKEFSVVLFSASKDDSRMNNSSDQIIDEIKTFIVSQTRNVIYEVKKLAASMAEVKLAQNEIRASMHDKFEQLKKLASASNRPQSTPSSQQVREKKNQSQQNQAIHNPWPEGTADVNWDTVRQMKTQIEEHQKTIQSQQAIINQLITQQERDTRNFNRGEAEETKTQVVRLLSLQID